MLGFQIFPPHDIAIRAPGHVAISHTGQKRLETEADGRWPMLTEAGGGGKMAYSELESVDFSTNVAPGMLGVQISSPDIITLAPRHVAIRHTDQMRPETEAAGRRRMLTEADGSRRMQKNGITGARIGRFLAPTRPAACWVARYALPTSSPRPPGMSPSDTRTRSDPKRKPTADGGC